MASGIFCVALLGSLRKSVVCFWMGYKTLFEEKEWDFMNRILAMSSILKVEDSIAVESVDVADKLKDAYRHPCEITNFNAEYCRS